ncbi:MAG: ABC transporter substrate-binding protein [Gammaproteobacteria bacterium]|nr:ABC transporter substrate-binding protein [Gammaproteobacteria bacterium]
MSHFVLATALAHNGMTPADVQVVNLAAGDAAAAFLGGRVPAVVVWNPWVNQIQSSGKGKALFTSKDMPGLIPDLLVARGPALADATKRAIFVGMVRAWYDTVAFIGAHPREAAVIMAKVVGLPPEEYATYLPGTRFFGAQENLIALGEPQRPESLVGVGPTIAAFLTENKLLEGKVDFAAAVDASLVREVAAKPSAD